MSTPQQQKDLETYRQTGVIGDSLKNIFIEDCLEELTNNLKSLKTYNSFRLYFSYSQSGFFCGFDESEDESYNIYNQFQHLEDYAKTIVVQTFLSRTPDGQAVMPFLNVETKEYKSWQNQEGWRDDIVHLFRFCDDSAHWENAFDDANSYFDKNNPYPKTLQALLLQQFVDVCFNQGKGYDLALQHINKLYIDHIYV
jgi:hypothetical protein